MVNGTGFVGSASATVGGQAHTVTVGSAAQLTVAVQAASLRERKPETPNHCIRQRVSLRRH